MMLYSAVCNNISEKTAVSIFRVENENSSFLLNASIDLQTIQHQIPEHGDLKTFLRTMAQRNSC
jgi:hypothetical protein